MQTNPLVGKLAFQKFLFPVGNLPKIGQVRQEGGLYAVTGCATLVGDTEECDSGTNHVYSLIFS